MLECLRTAYASRSRCSCVSENIFVILSRLVFVLRAQTNCKNISSAKEFVMGNEIQGPTKIVRIELLDPFPKIRRKESAILNIVMEPERTDIKLESLQFECLACPPGERSTTPCSNPGLSRVD